MEQMTKAEIHSELCRKMQIAKDAYCRNTYAAPEINIDRLVKYKRKQSVKKVSRIAAVFLVFIITSVFFAQEFFSDNGYGKYIVQKSVSSSFVTKCRLQKMHIAAIHMLHLRLT